MKLRCFITTVVSEFLLFFQLRLIALVKNVIMNFAVVLISFPLPYCVRIVPVYILAMHRQTSSFLSPVLRIHILLNRFVCLYRYICFDEPQKPFAIFSLLLSLRVIFCVAISASLSVNLFYYVYAITSILLFYCLPACLPVSLSLTFSQFLHHSMFQSVGLSYCGSVHTSLLSRSVREWIIVSLIPILHSTGITLWLKYGQFLPVLPVMWIITWILSSLLILFGIDFPPIILNIAAFILLLLLEYFHVWSLLPSIFEFEND
jgi:hypothetical protein